jgi:hypothetical protein
MLLLLFVFLLAAVAFIVSLSATLALTASRGRDGDLYLKWGWLLGAARLWAITAGAVIVIYMVAIVVI